MKVAYILQDFPRWSETFILREIVEMRRRGHDVVVLAFQDPGESVRHAAAQPVAEAAIYGSAFTCRDKLSALRHFVRSSPGRFLRLLAGLVADTLICPSAFAPLWRQLPMALAFARRVQRSGIARVHAHFAYRPADVAGVVGRLTGATVTVSAHAWDIHTQSARALRRRLANVHGVVACSADGRGVLQRKLGQAQRVALVHHGLPLADFASPDTKHAPPLLLGVGRLTDKKCFHELIEACARLRDQRLAFSCQVVGDGANREALAQQVADADLEGQVRIEHARPADALTPLFHQAGIFVHAARETKDGDREGIPNVVLEAMASRLPVVATRTGGIDEIVEHNVTGLLVEPGDVNGLTTSIASLLASPETRARLGEAGHRHVCEHYDIVRNVEQLERFLEESHGGQ